jgi:hypothetical protein
MECRSDEADWSVPATPERGNWDNATYAQSQWSAALQLRDELDKRFKELKD